MRNRKPRPWRDNRWFIIDGHDHVRACITRCLRREASAAAVLMFGEPMRALRLPEMSLMQRAECIHFPELTPAACEPLLGGVPFPIDLEARAEHTELRATWNAHTRRNREEAAMRAGGGQ
jgi:hypothetical protein